MKTEEEIYLPDNPSEDFEELCGAVCNSVKKLHQIFTSLSLFPLPVPKYFHQRQQNPDDSFW